MEEPNQKEEDSKKEIINKEQLTLEELDEIFLENFLGLK